MDWTQRFAEFVTLWVVIDPLGTLPVFLAVTSGLDRRSRRWIAMVSTAISFGVLVFFVFAGQWLLTSLDVSIASFQIAGGIVLFLFALTMISGHETRDVHPASDAPNLMDLAVHPLAVPSIASPGAMLAAVVLTNDSGPNITERLFTVVIFALVLLATLAILLAAGPISRLIGRGGSSIISRVMGMILAALAVDTVLRAIGTWLNLPPI